MNPQNELFDAIEDYLNGGMSEHERFAFEERIAHDNSLADKVAEVRASNEAIYYASLAEFKNTIGKNLKNIKYKPPIDWKKVAIVSVVSLAILSGVTTYFVSTDKLKLEDSKTETNKNNGTPESIQPSKNKSTSSKEKSIEGSTLSEQSINKESTVTLQTNNVIKQESIETDNAEIKSITVQKNTPSEIKVEPTQLDSKIIKNETPIQSENKILCDKSFKITSEASCKEKETGSISIISDGAYTYTYQVDIQSKTGSKGLFSNLSPGVYELLVTYGKECAYNKKVTIGEKWCAMNEAYSFNPDYNEKWKPMYESGSSGTILIYDKQGKEIYSLPFGSGNEEWIGNDKQGMAASVGIYIAIITYSDGRKEKVELTIVR